MDWLSKLLDESVWLAIKINWQSKSIINDTVKALLRLKMVAEWRIINWRKYRKWSRVVWVQVQVGMNDHYCNTYCNVCHCTDQLHSHHHQTGHRRYWRNRNRSKHNGCYNKHCTRAWQSTWLKLPFFIHSFSLHLKLASWINTNMNKSGKVIFDIYSKFPQMLTKIEKFETFLGALLLFVFLPNI